MSRLNKIYNRERKAVIRIERKIERSLPWGRLFATLCILCLISILVMLIVSLGFEGSISLKKEEVDVESEVRVKVDANKVMPQIINVVVPQVTYTITSTTTTVSTTASTTTTTSSTTTTLKSRHSGYPFLGVVFDDGVRYVRSGQDPGACGIRDSGINEGNKQ